MDLPDAPTDRAHRARLAPDLRYGTRAADGARRRRPRSRAGGHDAAVLDRARAHAAAAGLRDGRHATGAATSSLHSRASFRVASASTRDAGGSVGWLALLRAGLG